jgi:hypothetical protein
MIDAAVFMYGCTAAAKQPAAVDAADELAGHGISGQFNHSPFPPFPQSV